MHLYIKPLGFVNFVTTLKSIFITIVSIACVLSLPTQAQINTDTQLQLPELGDASSSTYSLQKEYELGRAWLKALRGQVQTISDPLLQDYIEGLTYNLATYSELKDRRLEIVMINNKTINAFAVPGGVIGVHNGLLLQAETEGQLASVVAHELSHLSQRHFARSMEAQKRSTIPTLAGLLAGVVLAATVGGDAGMAAIYGTQAANIQSQLRYSRLHEQEADRIGMQTLIRAGMDPNSSAAMFEKMQQLSRYSSSQLPEFLLSHPVTESRITDARNRARQQTKKIYTDSIDFHLMRARVEFSFFDNSQAAVDHFRTRVSTNARQPEANRYGLILALTANGNYDEAQQQLNTLRAASPERISYIVAQAELDSAKGNHQQAIKLLQNTLLTTPNNHPITMTLAKILLTANQPHLAEPLLENHTKIKPNDPSVWYLLAETYGLAGNIVGVHKARAEFFILTGSLKRAATQLSYALPLVKNNHVETISIQERIKQIRQMEIAMKNL
jgi:predicted Zn-dependent protease